MEKVTDDDNSMRKVRMNDPVGLLISHLFNESDKDLHENPGEAKGISVLNGEFELWAVYMDGADFYYFWEVSP